jgi:SRSO17 transposase
VDRALYVPQEWAEDRERCRAAGIPDTVEFATKPELARQMIGRTLDAGVPVGWVAGDEVYGSDSKVRRLLEARQVSYVLAVASNQHLWWPALEQQRVDAIAQRLPKRAWKRLSAGSGSKGERLYDWALVRLSEEQGWARTLLLRRSLGEKLEHAYYLCYSPIPKATLATLVRVAGQRWQIEQCFETAKGECGLDHYEVRHWKGWQRHITLAMLAHAVLAVLRSRGEKNSPWRRAPQRA